MHARVVDVAVHPNPRAADDLRQYMSKPMASSIFPGPVRATYPVPTGPEVGGAFLESARPAGSEQRATYWKTPHLPASDPWDVREAPSRRGVGPAVLVPLARGVLPNRGVGSEIAAATNRWLAETWLADATSSFWGSIRINGEDPARACKEIARWAPHPDGAGCHALGAHRPYGHPEYFRIWETAVEHGLPVAIYADGGSSIQYPPTANGLQPDRSPSTARCTR